MVWIPVRARCVASLKNPDQLWACKGSISISNRGSFPAGRVAGVWKWPLISICLNLELRLGMSMTILPWHPHSTKHNISLTYRGYHSTEHQKHNKHNHNVYLFLIFFCPHSVHINEVNKFPWMECDIFIWSCAFAAVCHYCLTPPAQVPQVQFPWCSSLPPQPQFTCLFDQSGIEFYHTANQITRQSRKQRCGNELQVSFR